jgi:hypothetical protein
LCKTRHQGITTRHAASIDKLVVRKFCGQ